LQMAQEQQAERPVLERIEAARRQALMRLSVEAEEKEHYNEALDGYRQIIDQYHGTPEEEEARERMLDLAYLFESEEQHYRAKHLYWLLEMLYTPQRYKNIQEVRRARVKEILDQIHAEEERRAKLEEAEEL